MKTRLSCPCGEFIQGQDEDDLVEKAFAHLREKHPEIGVVMLSQYVMQRDARYYEAPERFHPERWTEAFESALPRGSFFPFSAGERHCIGEGFAWQEALLILATLLERWRFELVPGQQIRPRPSVTLRPDRPIRMTVHSR